MPRPRKPWFRSATGWWQVKIGGRVYKLARGKQNRALAEAEFHRLMAECSLNPHPESGPDRLTVAALLDTYLDLGCSDNRPRTFAEKKRILQEFADAFGAKLVRDLIPFHLTSWLAANPEWRSTDTRAKRISTVKAALNWGLAQRLITANPLASVKIGGGNRRRPMTGEEYARLRTAARTGGKSSGAASTSGRRFREILAFMRLTGARPGEVRDLKWEHVSPYAIILPPDCHKTGRKTGKPRRIVLVPAASKILDLIRKRGDHNQYVFVSHLGRPWHRTSLAQKLRRLRARAGVPEDAVLYGLRHRYGTAGAKAGINAPTLAELMGHADVRMTQHYIHLTGEDEHLLRAAQLVNRRSRRGTAGA